METVPAIALLAANLGESASTATGPTRYNIGPLTGIFTPPSRCSDQCFGPFLDFDWTADPSTKIRTSYCMVYASQCVTSQTDCMPSIVDPSGRTRTWNLWGLYSPGLRCPNGWTTSMTISYGMSIDSQLHGGVDTAISLLKKGEQGALCCPENFSLAGGDGRPLHCKSEDPESEYRMITCGGLGTMTFTDNPDDLTKWNSAAPVIQLVWQTSDLTIPVITPTEERTSTSTTPTSSKPTVRSTTTTSSSTSSTSILNTSTSETSTSESSPENNASPTSTATPTPSPMSVTAATVPITKSSTTSLSPPSPSLLNSPTSQTATASPTTVLPLSTETPKHGLSTDQLAAIITCACVTVIALGVGLGIWLARRRTRKDTNAATLDTPVDENLPEAVRDNSAKDIPPRDTSNNEHRSLVQGAPEMDAPTLPTELMMNPRASSRTGGRCELETEAMISPLSTGGTNEDVGFPPRTGEYGFVDTTGVQGREGNWEAGQAGPAHQQPGQTRIE